MTDGLTLLSPFAQVASSRNSEAPSPIMKPASSAHKTSTSLLESAAETAPLTDDMLIEDTLAGDQMAFEQLVRRHSRRVFAIARHFFRTPETVEDVAQETFTKIYFSLASYRRGASFEQWLARITVNNCYDELRRRKKRSESLLTDLTEDEGTWLENKLASASFNIQLHEHERAIAAEITEKLLDKLSPEDRLILVMLHAQESSVREIAEMMGWSEAKVKIRAFRARHAMRRAFNRLRLAEQRKMGGRTL